MNSGMKAAKHLIISNRIYDMVLQYLIEEKLDEVEISKIIGLDDFV